MRKSAPLFTAFLLAAACSAGQPRLQDKGYSVTGQDPSFRFEVERQLLRDWGGPGSAKFNQVLEEELERLRLCRNGYALRNEGVREGLFSVTGRCKS
jgi:hypothetical protein